MSPAEPMKLTPAGEFAIGSLNSKAAAEFSNRGLPHHTPASPGWWFAGLAREIAAGTRKGRTPIFEIPGLAARLTDETVLLLRELGIRVYLGRRVSAARKAELLERRRTFCACLADADSECHECPAGFHHRCYDKCLLETRAAAEDMAA